MVDFPTVDADDYLSPESEDALPKHGTTVQSGWGAADTVLNPKKTTNYPTDFKFSADNQLVRFLNDEPFAIYEQHWIDAITSGKRSFVCLGDDCPLCIRLGDKPRGRFAFNILVLSDGEPSHQILTAGPMLARQLQTANSDPRRGPLSKYYWAISRQGIAASTQYTLDRVKAADLVDEWELDPQEIDAISSKVTPYDKSVIYLSPREELLEVSTKLLS